MNLKDAKTRMEIYYNTICESTCENGQKAKAKSW